jgi:hypothetical protein
VDRMPLESQTLYAELLERLSALEARRSIGYVSGSFVTKRIGGETYYYFQYSSPGGVKRQIYIGRRDQTLDQIVKRYREGREWFAEDAAGIQRLCALLRAGGALVIDSASARVLKALSDGGIFHLDGVLIGTQAFMVLGNLLGVRWAYNTHTGYRHCGGSNRQHCPSRPGDGCPWSHRRPGNGFSPVPQLDPRKPSTSFVVRGKGLRVDLLTPLRGRRASGPVRINRFRAAAQPLPFLDFLIASPVRGAVVDGGGILVNVPDPARFAFHKLIVSGERGVAMHT